MDRRERMDDFQLALQAAQEGLLSRIWTAMPAQVVSYDATKQTVTLQATIQAQVQQQSGEWKNTTLPVFQDVPVAFPGGGGFTLSFPLAEGDEGIAIFGKNCIDAWWQQGGIQPQAEVRSHNLSDAMFVPRLRSVPKVPTGLSTATAQLRSDDGESYVELAGGHVINIVCPGGLNITATGNAHITAPTSTIDGDVVVNGKLTVSDDITGQANIAIAGDATVQGTVTGVVDVIAGTISGKNHLTSGVTVGAGISGPPLP